MADALESHCLLRDSGYVVSEQVEQIAALKMGTAMLMKSARENVRLMAQVLAVMVELKKISTAAVATVAPMGVAIVVVAIVLEIALLSVRLTSAVAAMLVASVLLIVPAQGPASTLT